MRRRKRKTPAQMTPAQITAARELARETLAGDRLAVERYAGQAVPRMVPEDAGPLTEGEAGNG